MIKLRRSHHRICWLSYVENVRIIRKSSTIYWMAVRCISNKQLYLIVCWVECVLLLLPATLTAYLLFRSDIWLESQRASYRVLQHFSNYLNQYGNGRTIMLMDHAKSFLHLLVVQYRVKWNQKQFRNDDCLLQCNALQSDIPDIMMNWWNKHGSTILIIVIIYQQLPIYWFLCCTLL